MPKTKKINKKKASNVIPIKQDAIENEDYELAAKLRDEINQRK